jgi:hypothetical protein
LFHDTFITTLIISFEEFFIHKFSPFFPLVNGLHHNLPATAIKSNGDDETNPPSPRPSFVASQAPSL